MEFNPGRCQVLNITRSKSPVKSRYFMHIKELESVDVAKHLGVAQHQQGPKLEHTHKQYYY